VSSPTTTAPVNLLTTFFDHLNQASVAAAIAVFVVALLIELKKANPAVQLDKILGKALAGSAFPTGIALLICAFKPALVSQLQDLHMHLAAAGLALLFLSYQGAFGK
jgi:hypothetical protein